MSTQALVAKLIFSLPSGVIQAMAGPKTVVDGLTLDPRIALMAKQAAARPPITSATPAQARAGMQAAFAMIDAPRREDVGVRDLTVPGGGGAQLEARLYTPPASSGGEGPRPLLVYMHQGGCVLGGLWTCDAWCSMLAEDVGAVVLNVNYRHAPEHVFPAAADDAIAAFDWAVANAASLGADPKRVGVGGDSAGGYLSAVVCQARKKAGKSQPALQLLIYPATDWTSTGGTMDSMANAYPLSRTTMEWFAGHYLPAGVDKTDWRVSPGLAPDKTGLAPALVYAAGFDPLTTQAQEYADMLKAAGVKMTYVRYGTLSHSFTAMSGAVPMAKRALREIAADVKAAFAARV